MLSSQKTFMKKQNKHIAFSEMGVHLSTRLEGATMRNKIAAFIASEEYVIFDFKGVEVISNSFADECFAKLMVDFDLSFIKAHTTFQNANPFIKAVIANSFKERLQAMHVA